MRGVVLWHAPPLLRSPTRINETIPAVNHKQRDAYSQTEMNEIVNLDTVLSDKVNPPQSSIRVTGRETHETVCQSILSHNATKSTSQMWCTSQCPIPISNNSLHDKHGPVIGMFVTHTLDGKSDMSMLHRIISYSDFRPNESRFGFMTFAKIRISPRRRNFAEMFLRKLDNFFMRHTTSTNQDHPVSTIILANIVR